MTSKVTPVAYTLGVRDAKPARPLVAAARLLLGLCVALGFTLSLVAVVEAPATQGVTLAHHAHHMQQASETDRDGSSPPKSPHCLACSLVHGTTLAPPAAVVETTARAPALAPYAQPDASGDRARAPRARAPPTV